MVLRNRRVVDLQARPGRVVAVGLIKYLTAGLPMIARWIAARDWINRPTVAWQNAARRTAARDWTDCLTVVSQGPAQPIAARDWANRPTFAFLLPGHPLLALPAKKDLEKVWLILPAYLSCELHSRSANKNPYSCPIHYHNADISYRTPLCVPANTQ